jgi:quaternary ammonium compound-resistance protein SugE
MAAPLEFRTRYAVPGEDKTTRENAMSWIYLLVAGVLEVVWAITLKHTHGFTRLWPSILVGSAIAGSMFFLALAVRTIPIGAGYAVWVSIGIIGAVISGPLFYNQPLRPIQLLFLGLLVISILGLKLTSSAR